MSQVDVSVQSLREAFPEFADTALYPDGYIQRFLTQATAYIKTKNFRIDPSVRILAIQYMTGHLMTLSAVNAQGMPNADSQTAGSTVVSAHIHDVSVSIQAPIARDAFEQWIQTTPYGKSYWALMSANNPTGNFYVGTPRAYGIR